MFEGLGGLLSSMSVISTIESMHNDVLANVGSVGAAMFFAGLAGAPYEVFREDPKDGVTDSVVKCHSHTETAVRFRAGTWCWRRSPDQLFWLESNRGQGRIHQRRRAGNSSRGFRGTVPKCGR